MLTISLNQRIQNNSTYTANETLLKDGMSISGTLLSKSTNQVQVDFDGQQMTIPTDISIKEEVGEAISFDVNKTDSGWQFIYSNKEVVGDLEATKGLDRMKQQVSTINEEETSDDGQLTIHNYTKKINEAMDELLRTTSREDIEAMKMYGFDIRKLSVDMMHQFIKNHGGVEYISAGDVEAYIESEVKQYEEFFSDKERLKEAAKGLATEDIIITEKNLKEMTAFLDQLETIKNVNESNIYTLLRSENSTTVNNIYKAMYTPESRRYIETALSDQQIVDYLNKIDIDINENQQESLNVAKKMLSKEIPLTKENFEAYEQLKDIQQYIEKNRDVIIQAAATKIKDGEKAMDLNIFDLEKSQPMTKEELNNVLQELPSLNREHISTLLEQNQPVNLQNLIKVSQSEGDTISLATDETGKTIQYERQLNEIRLQMTYDVAERLNRQGIKIDTKPLQELVDLMKEQEQISLKAGLEVASAKISEENVSKMQELYTAIKAIKNSMETCINAVQQREVDFTLEGMQEAIAKAAERSYDALGTRVDRSLGDGFHRIQNQIPELLEFNNIEVTEETIRIAAALIKNEIDVTQENMNNAMMLDSKVQKLIDRLHPTIAASLLKDGQDPMTMHVDEVNAYIDNFNDTYGDNIQDKVAAIIARMDQEQEMSTEERQGVIAIYRMLHTIDENQGQAASLLMREGLDVTLENLLEASKHIKKTKGSSGQIDINIDNNFGVVEERIQDNKNIRSALDEALMSFEANQERANDLLSEGLDVSNNNLTEHYITEEEIKQLMEEISLELIKDNQVYVETNLRNLEKIDHSTIQRLITASITPSIENFSTLKKMLRNPHQLADTLQELNQEMGFPILSPLEGNLQAFQEEKSSQDLLDEINDLSNDLKEQLIYNDMERKAIMMDQVSEIQRMSKLQKRLQEVEDVYQIPMVFNGAISSLNIYVLNDGQSGINNGLNNNFTAALAIKTNNLGLVKGHFTINNDEVDVTLTTDQEEGEEILKVFERDLEEVVEKAGLKLKQSEFKEEELTDPDEVNSVRLNTSSNIEVLV
ncbi:DUF6240 domain-containing protein [Vallitalea okinawensis]|uniref:DUF6240 domain-containing protein n=1 Tax=Vallitalea okinawensis TaxID=2078660 RepID=UPI000CFAF955|nr:DUF6240 domain-containing protein [Vallitalea okinawensis]